MQLVMRQPAEPGTVFAPGAFERQIGKRVPFKLGDQLVGEAEVVAVTVADDGAWADLTCEIADEAAATVAGLTTLGVPGMSFGFQEPDLPTDPWPREFIGLPEYLLRRKD